MSREDLNKITEVFRSFNEAMKTSTGPALACADESDPYGKDPAEPGAKLDKGKVKAGVLLDFSRALWAVAEVGSHGAEKYSRGGWQHVPDAVERYEDAFMRHLLKLRPAPVDESGLATLAHLAWGVLAVLELEMRMLEGAEQEKVDG